MFAGKYRRINNLFVSEFIDIIGKIYNSSNGNVIGFILFIIIKNFDMTKTFLFWLCNILSDREIDTSKK